jgi:aminopeptidase YwaD
MFHKLWSIIRDEVSGAAAARAVAEIARFHRIQASPGFRQAAEWVCGQISHSLVAGITSFPADPDVHFWGAASFQEWNARAATLHLIEPADQARKLADFRDLPLHLVARSLPFDGEAEVVVLEKGEEEAEYEGKDLAGKVVLARGNVRRVHDLAVVRRGAVGLIYDGMAEQEPVRPAWALPDAVQYTSFWWQGQEPRGFGFALSPRQGEALRRLAREHTLRVRVHVDADLYSGWLEVAETFIPGATDEEIVLVAHLCHPQPSANDNASGAAALLETARALAALVERGELQPPRRTIRFLWVPEITGSMAYLAFSEGLIPCMVAGLNLDMVGEDQDQCGSSLLVESPPDALPSFAGALLARMRDLLLPEVKTFGGVGGYPLFRTADVPFSGGSDHYVFSDPSVGVPMPMLIQWPDRFYHTSADTPDRVDPKMLARVAALSGLYAYWLAQAGEQEARWLARELSARFRQRVLAELQAAVTEAEGESGPGREEVRQRLEYRIARHREALESVRRLAPVDVSPWQSADADFAVQEYRRVADDLPDRPAPAAPEVEGTDWVPRRRFRGPLHPEEEVARRDAATRDRWWEFQQRLRKTASALPTLAEYWADGHRTVGEIAALVRHETGVEATALIAEYFRWLADLGLVDGADLTSPPPPAAVAAKPLGEG